MRPDAHDIECARAAYAALIERAKTQAEKRKLRKELLEYENKK